MLKYANVRYKFRQHQNIEAVMVKLHDGRKIRGFLAMKKDEIKRPMVIVRCGVFCNAKEASGIRSFLIHLFDELVGQLLQIILGILLGIFRETLFLHPLQLFLGPLTRMTHADLGGLPLGFHLLYQL